MIDVPPPHFGAAAAFWAKALGRQLGKPAADADPYLALLPANQGVRVALQVIDQPARVHLDIETDDVAAEVARLRTAGATVVDHIEDWVVLADPAGLLLCVIPVDSTDFDSTATTWG